MEQASKGKVCLMRGRLSSVNKYVFMVSAALFAFSFTPRDNYKGITDIDPALFDPPSQTRAVDTAPVKITRDSIHYLLKPLAEYSVSALVVSKSDYSLFSNKTERLFTIDLALIWGANVKTGVFRDKAISFKQDMRWGFVSWTRPLEFNFDEFSNNHLVIADKAIRGRARTISPGDQVKIKGELVSLDAIPFGNAGKDVSAINGWTSSTNRSDSGAGACEIIYVKDLEILKKSDTKRRFFHQAGLYGIWLSVFIGLVIFFSDGPGRKI